MGLQQTEREPGFEAGMSSVVRKTLVRAPFSAPSYGWRDPRDERVFLQEEPATSVLHKAASQQSQLGVPALEGGSRAPGSGVPPGKELDARS